MHPYVILPDSGSSLPVNAGVPLPLLHTAQASEILLQAQDSFRCSCFLPRHCSAERLCMGSFPGCCLRDRPPSPSFQGFPKSTSSQLFVCLSAPTSPGEYPRVGKMPSGQFLSPQILSFSYLLYLFFKGLVDTKIHFYSKGF